MHQLLQRGRATAHRLGVTGRANADRLREIRSWRQLCLLGVMWAVLAVCVPQTHAADRAERTADALAFAHAAEALWSESLARDPERHARVLLEQLNEDFGGFQEHRLGRFVLISDATPARTRERLRLMERTRIALDLAADRMGVVTHEHNDIFLGVMFSEHGVYRRFAAEEDGVNASWIAGYYALEPNRIVIYDDASRPDVQAAKATLREQTVPNVRTTANSREAEAARRELASREEAIAASARRTLDAKTVHEAVHLIAFNNGLQDPLRVYPLWLSEGLAMAFEPDRRGRLGPEHPALGRPATYRDAADSSAFRGEIPLAELVSMRRVPSGDHADIALFYAQSHALFVELYRQNPRKLGEYIKRLRKLPGREATPARLLTEFEAVFGDAHALERSLIGPGVMASAPTGG